MKLLLKLIKGIIGIIGIFAFIILSVVILFKCDEAKRVDYAFMIVDERLGIEREDYCVKSRVARLFGLQDPIALQKVKLNRKGREKIDKYILQYQDTLKGLNIPESVSKYYKPRLDRSNCNLSNGLPDNVDLDIFSEIIEDSEDAYVRMQTSQVGRYFEQFCWLGGDFWKIIVDRKRGVIYREYGSV